MATVAHTIYSHYDPNDRELLERETGQRPDDLENDPEAHWRNESGQIYKKATLAGAPVFVPAKIADGEWASYSASAPTLASTLKGKDEKESVAGWYKNLTAGVSTNPPPGPSTSAVPTVPTNHDRPKFRTKTDKNTWFIQNAISSASAPSSSASTPLPFSIGSSNSQAVPATPAPPPTLADLLERDPPPSSSDPKLKHPAWIALGPGNKGFGMLQRSGWSEGEALGPYAQRMRREKEIEVSTLLSDSEDTSGSGKPWKGKEREDRSTTKVEFIEVPIKGKRKRITSGDDQDITELRKVEVVDLTELSDEDLGEEEDEEEDDEIKEVNLEEGRDSPLDSHGHGGTALLTPISTILKTDKLGIGLKPKLTSSALTKGAYRVPVLKHTKRNQAYIVKSNGFRVTNTRSVVEEIRRREREQRELWGRGRRGLERKKKREESERKGLLAYMNE